MNQKGILKKQAVFLSFPSTLMSVSPSHSSPSPLPVLLLTWLMYAARPLANQMQSALLIGFASIGRLRPVGLMASGGWVGGRGGGWRGEGGGGRGGR